MALEEMKLVSITGKNTNLEQFLAQNLLNLDIQIEDAKKIYKKGWKLEYFNYDYTIKEYIKKCEKIANELQIELDKNNYNCDINNSINEIKDKIDKISNRYDEIKENVKELKAQQKSCEEEFSLMKNLGEIDSKIENLYNLKYMKFRYGTVPTKNLNEINKKMENTEAIYFELKKEEEYTWILYLTTEEFNSKVDSFFNIQDFERIWIPKEAEGTPKEYLKKLDIQLGSILTEIENQQIKLQNLKSDEEKNIISIYKQLLSYENVNRLKKYIVHDQNQTFYIVLWVSKSNFENIKNIIANYQELNYDIVEDDEVNPPTKLKNLKIFRPFETLIKMYGVPNSKEIDPTGLVAITAFIMFGFMFGDVGHGLVIFIVGLILAKRKASLGPVLAMRRHFINNIWNIIWECFWKRKYYKTCTYKSNE